MTVKIGTIRVERNRAIQGQRDMRKTNRELTKERDDLQYQLALREDELAHLVHPFDLAKYRREKA